MILYAREFRGQMVIEDFLILASIAVAALVIYMQGFDLSQKVAVRPAVKRL